MPERQKGRQEEEQAEEQEERAHAAEDAASHHPLLLLPCPPSEWPAKQVESDEKQGKGGAGEGAGGQVAECCIYLKCCIYQAQEHLYAPPQELRHGTGTDGAHSNATGNNATHHAMHDEARGRGSLMRWRACAHLCSRGPGAQSEWRATRAAHTMVEEAEARLHVTGWRDATDVTGWRQAPATGWRGAYQSWRGAYESRHGGGPQEPASVGAVTWVGPASTLHALSDALTDGVAGSFVRWQADDVFAAVLAPDACFHHLRGPDPLPRACRGLSEAVVQELREALELDDAEMDGAVIFKGLAGINWAGWNCSCEDTRLGWAHVERRRDCCAPQAESAFRVSQGHALHRLLRDASSPRLWHTVYAAEAVERVAVTDSDGLVRFLSMLRQRRPVLLITSADVASDVAALVVGPDCQVLTAARSEVLMPHTLDRLQDAALAALSSTHATHANPRKDRVRVVVLALGSTAGIILQKRLCQRLFSPMHMHAERESGAAAKGRVMIMDMSAVVELLTGVSPDLVAVGRGYTLGVWERASGMDGHELRRRLMRAQAVAGQLKVLVATALVLKEQDVWNRTALYQDTFRTLARLGYPLPLIAEAVHMPGQGGSMLDRYGEVVYTAVNDKHYMANQGVNEARSLLVALARFGLAGNTMVVKLTGRYTFVDRSMFELLEDNMETLDGLVSVAAHKSLMFTGCFAMRAHLLQRALEGSDWNAVSHGGVHLEFLVLEHARNLCEATPRGLNCRILHLSRLGVAARRSDSPLAVVW
jgi:hypothetical protein